MRIFVTGASGYFGARLIAGLTASGHEVLGMSRRPETDTLIRDLGGLPIRSDLINVTAHDLKDAEVVVHCAAKTAHSGSYTSFLDANVSGTKSLLDAATDAGTRRFIHISSEAALFAGRNAIDLQEDVALEVHSPHPYVRTKAMAEELVSRSAQNGLDAVILRPRLIWGPLDRLSQKLLQVGAKGWAWVDHGNQRTSTTHYRNLIHAVLLATRNGQSGKAYFIADDGETTIRHFVDKVAGALGLTLPDRSIPGWLASFLAEITERIWPLVRPSQEPPVTRLEAALARKSFTVSTALARTELGYVPVISREEGLAERRGLSA